MMRVREGVAQAGAWAARSLRGSFATAAGLSRRTGGILWNDGGTILFASAAAALLCTLGQLGLPLLFAAFFLGIGAAAAGGTHPFERTGLVLRIGGLVLVCSLPCLGAVLVGSRLAEAHGEAHYAAGWALFLGLTFLGTFVLLPFLEAATRLARRRLGIGDAIASALVATGRRGIVRTTLLGVLAAAAVALVPLLDVYGPVRLTGVTLESATLYDALIVAAAGGTASWSMLLLLGGVLATEPSETRVRSRSAFTFVVLGIVLFVAATLAGTTLLPAPLSSGLPDEPLGSNVTMAAPLHVAVESSAHGETSYLVVRERGIVRTMVPVPSSSVVTHVAAASGNGYAVVVSRSSVEVPFGWVRIDADGRRTDDGPVERVMAHVRIGPALAFAVSALCVLLAIFRMRGRTRLHRAVRRGKETTLLGRLRASDGEETEARGGFADTDGWRVEARDGDAVVSLPPRVPVLGGASELALVDGQEIEVVSPVAVGNFAFREGSAPFPKGAVLVLPGSGRLDELVGTWALAPAGGLLGASSVAAIAGTLLTLGAASTLPQSVLGGETITAAVATPLASALEAFVPEPDDGRALRVAASSHRGAITVVSPNETAISTGLRSWLGVMSSMPDGCTMAPDLTLEVAPDSLPDLLGFREGDQIVAVAGIPVSDVGRLTELVRANRSAGALAVRVLRDGVPVDLIFRVER